MTRPIEIEAWYALDHNHATLQMDCTVASKTMVSVLHECFFGDAHCYEFAGGLRGLQLHVTHGESLTLIAKAHGHVIGALVNEIVCDSCSRVLLLPRGGYNLLVYQNRLDESQASRVFASRAEILNVALTTRTTSTQLLVDLLEETQQFYTKLSRPLPEMLGHLLPSINEAIAENEDAYSRDVAGYLCQVLESLDLVRMPRIQVLHEQVMAAP